MPDIRITVHEKIAEVVGAPEIVCGNSDYTAVFDFDSEWSLYDQKTARFIWMDLCTGEKRHWDVLFSGDAAPIPAVYNTDKLLIGVYAGDIRTTTVAKIPCDGCITDGRPLHDDPAPDVYEQLRACLEQLDTGGSAEPENIALLTTAAHPEIMWPDSAQFIPLNRWGYWQETNDDLKQLATVTAAPTADCLMLACVMHRDEIDIEGDDWTKLVTSKAAKSRDGEPQWITVYVKKASAGSYTVNVTQASSVRLSLKVLAVYEAEAVSVAGNEVVSELPYTPPQSSGKRRLYLLSSYYATGTNIAITVTHGDLDLRKAEETRFSVFYNYRPDMQITPTFGYSNSSYTTDSINAIVLDIEEG